MDRERRCGGRVESVASHEESPRPAHRRPRDVAWLCGAAPAFDEAVCAWLTAQDVEVHCLEPLPRPRHRLPALTRLLRVRAYLRRAMAATDLVLPYLAGDSLLLAGARTQRTLGAALGSDVLRRPEGRRQELLLRRALLRVEGLWAVSPALSRELESLGRAPNWSAPVGVDLKRLPPIGTGQRERGRVFSARREAPDYRRSWIRTAASFPSPNVVEADAWPLERMLEEYQRAEIVVSLPSTDGAPATLMEALSCGAHVVASGGPTVRSWIEKFGGTYGEPRTPENARELIELGMRRAQAESLVEQRERATRARRTFDRDVTLRPLLAWLQAGEREE